MKASDFSISSSKSSNSFAVYVEQMHQGITVAYVTKKRNQTDSAAYIHPILKKLEDKSTAKELDIDFVSFRRKNEKSNDGLAQCLNIWFHSSSLIFNLLYTI
mgnify:CR=1 FL=1